MRIRTAACIPLLALLLLAACGSDDEEPTSSASASAPADEEATTETSEAAEDEGADADLEAAVEAAQLEVEDLGEGWTLTETVAAGDQDESPNPLDDCVGDLRQRIEAATVAESEQRTFTFDDGAVSVPTEVESSSVALDDEALFAEMHETFRDEAFLTCLTDTLRDQLGAEQQVNIGEVEVTDGVDPQAAPDAVATALLVPLETEAAGSLRLSITIITTGSVGTSLSVFGSPDQPIGERAVELAAVLAGRQGV